jgi:glycosyltransferase involved in cell wall biosynthesis
VPKPEISVVVASHDRPLRLRWLLNALEDQSLSAERWEVIVGHDSTESETEQLLDTHPLAASGNLRHVRLPPDSAPPGANRNAAWRIARAPVVAFTDDDCRPPVDWLENALSAALQAPGAIVQGATRKDPREANIEHAVHYHSQLISPPTPWSECCNIVYPRAVLERLDGFREDTYTGEDTDLALRAAQLGVEKVAAPRVLTYHAVVETTLTKRLRALWRWQDFPILVKRHPEIREAFPLWIFWKRTHALLPAFLGGLYLGQRRGLQWSALCVPWLAHILPAHGTDPRGRYRNVVELPSLFLVNVTEFLVLAIGSIRHRAFLL